MHGHGGRGGSRRGWIWGLVLVAGGCGTAGADVIILRGGGEVQGKVINDPKKPETVQVLLLNGRNPITFQKKQILQVVPKASPLDDYLLKRQQVAPTAQAEYDLGVWCEQNQLTDLARLHFEAALGHDKVFGPAHKKLGHILHGDRWLSLDELRQVQGLVKYRGQWITQEEKAKRDEAAQTSATQSGWVRRIRMLRQSLGAGESSQSREAEGQLMRIQEPEAVAPLVKVLGNDEPSIRLLLAQILGNIPGKEAARALVNMVLAEVQSEVRSTVLEQLKQRDDAGVVPQLVKALRSENVTVINRAAWTLGNLGVITAVPSLIGSLVTTEERIVLVNEGAGQGAGLGVGVGPGPALMAMNQNWLGYLTGPVVGPGVVAYGATSVPFYSTAQVLGGGGFMGVGQGASGSGRGPTPKAMTFTYQNTEVHTALTRLTGQDFGYDIPAWRRWMKLSFNPNPHPVRQVPQP
jgi:HEAT repeats